MGTGANCKCDRFVLSNTHTQTTPHTRTLKHTQPPQRDIPRTEQIDFEEQKNGFDMALTQHTHTHTHIHPLSLTHKVKPQVCIGSHGLPLL